MFLASLNPSLVSLRPKYLDAGDCRPTSMITLRHVVCAIALFLFAGCANPMPIGEQPPIVKQRFEPQFPFELFQAGTSGFAKVSFVVTPDGSVADARVVEASHEDFGRSAIACITKWKYKPATKDGRPTASPLEQSFTFDNPKGGNRR